MIATLLHWIAAHGYGVIFTLFALGIVGLPMPDEWLLAYLGFLIYKGNLLRAPVRGPRTPVLRSYRPLLFHAFSNMF
jgi:hypothetical protein